MTWVELLERDDELRLLGRAWQEARGGEGSIVLLAGESGIRKTSLARLFAADPDVGDVLWGVCDPLGVPRPLGPLHDVAADLGEPAAGLLRAGAPPHERSTARSSTRSPPAPCCSSSTTCSRPTRRPSTCCASCSAGSPAPAR